MNDFDKFLELKLRQMLDPVVGTPPPARRRLKRSPKPGSPKPFLALEPAPVALDN